MKTMLGRAGMARFDHIAAAMRGRARPARPMIGAPQAPPSLRRRFQHANAAGENAMIDRRLGPRSRTRCRSARARGLQQHVHAVDVEADDVDATEATTPGGTHRPCHPVGADRARHARACRPPPAAVHPAPSTPAGRPTAAQPIIGNPWAPPSTAPARCRRTEARAPARRRSSSTATSSAGPSSYSGLTGPVTGAHFHGPAPAGANAGVVVPFAGSLASPITGSKPLTAAQIAELKAASGTSTCTPPPTPAARSAARSPATDGAGRCRAPGQARPSPAPLRAGAARGAAPCRWSSSAARR